MRGQSSTSSSSSADPSGPAPASDLRTAQLKDNIEADRGFIITFDDDATTAPKQLRPKPQLGAKRTLLHQPSPTRKVSQGPTLSLAPPPTAAAFDASGSKVADSPTHGVSHSLLNLLLQELNFNSFYITNLYPTLYYIYCV